MWGRFCNLNRLKRLSEFKINKNNKYKLDFAFAVIDSAIQNKIFPGAQIFISKSGEVVASESFGHYTYDRDSNVVTKESMYDIASLTKVVSITPVVMKLIGLKKIGLKHTLCQFYNNINQGLYKHLVNI